MEMADVAAMIDESEATVFTPSAEGNALEAAE
jgi:hypothetical protein